METDKNKTTVELHHFNLTFEFCKTLDKDKLFFYFFRKWTQNLGSTTNEKSENADNLFKALKDNQHLSNEDKEKLFKQLFESLDTERCIHLNYAKGLEYRLEKWNQDYGSKT